MPEALLNHGCILESNGKGDEPELLNKALEAEPPWRKATSAGDRLGGGSR